MNSRKRPATEELLPLRAPKVSRRPCMKYAGEQVEAASLSERWFNLGAMALKLANETFNAVVESVKGLLPDELNITPSPQPLLPPSRPPITQSETSNMLPPPPPMRPGTVPNHSNQPNTHQPVAGPSKPSQQSHFLRDTHPSHPRSSSGTEHSMSLFTFRPPKPNPAKEKGAQETRTTFLSGLPTPPLTSSASSSRTSSRVLTADPPSLSELHETIQRLEKDDKRREEMWKTRGRKHIYQEQHKKKVKEDKVQLHEELDQLKADLYKAKRESGYGGSPEEFLGWLAYSKKLEDIERERILFPSRSYANLREAQLDEPNRRHSGDYEFLQRALYRAKKTQENAPKPITWSPGLDQLHVRNKTRDAAIDQRLHPKVQIPTEMAAEEEAKVGKLLSMRGVISKCGREQVNNQDISRLKPGQWLNDEVINFYGQMILSRAEGSGKENVGNGANGQRKTLKAHYFNTFFWPKLTQDGYQKGRLAKWTKKIDIFSKDVILIPINHGNAHWTAAAINFRRKRVEFYDSMGTCRDYVYKHLRNYLDLEHRDKKKKPFDFTGWEDYWMEDIPQQENGYDCGVFTCQFLESLSRGEEFFAFEQRHMPYLRKRMILEIANAKLRDKP